MVVGYGNNHGVQVLPIHENSVSGMATNPTAAQGLWNPNSLSQKAADVIGASVKRVTYSPLPFVCSVWSQRHDQGRCPTEASCLHSCQKFTFASVAYGRKGRYNLLCKIHSTKRARLKTIYPAFREKNIIAIIICEVLINIFERFLYFLGYDCKA